MAYVGLSQHIDFLSLKSPADRFELQHLIGEGTYGEGKQFETKNKQISLSACHKSSGDIITNFRPVNLDLTHIKKFLIISQSTAPMIKPRGRKLLLRYSNRSPIISRRSRKSSWCSAIFQSIPICPNFTASSWRRAKRPKRISSGSSWSSCMAAQSPIWVISHFTYLSTFI